MTKISTNSTAKIIVTLQYTTPKSRHTDHYYCPDVNMWRDVFRKEHADLLLGLQSGDQVQLEAEKVFLPRNSAAVRSINSKQWQPPEHLQWPLEPRIGRWYPQGYLTGVPNIFPQTTAPFRIINKSSKTIDIDCNHPLAGQKVSIEVGIEEISKKSKERGGRCADWLEEACANGPGMQIFPEHGGVDFSEPQGMKRVVEQDDSLFYHQPRLVDHIDSMARHNLLLTTSKLISNDMRVLDVMSSIQSHMPDRIQATGLGMNEDEMAANPSLNEYVVHDLNVNPILPFPESSFDCICCHLSFEYLLQPAAIIAECERILRTGGLLIISISNRWFPEKVTRIWQMLHDFERMAYVMKYVSERFTKMETVSYRNWPRPYDDPHYFKQQTSDPVYVVSARKK